MTRSFGPNWAVGTLSKPNPYRARQRQVEAARAVRQSIAESPTIKVESAFAFALAVR